MFPELSPSTRKKKEGGPSSSPGAMVLDKIAAPPAAMVACDYCGVLIDKRELKHHQAFDCLQSELRIMQCPKGCGQNVEARNLDKHVQSECPMELVPCDFQLTGCPRRVARRALKEHNTENVEFHLGLINRAAVQRDERMANLERALRSREMELQKLSQTLEKERAERLEMMESYDKKIQELLEKFEENLLQNTEKCDQALLRVDKSSKLVGSIRTTTDGHTYEIMEVKKEIADLSYMFRLGTFGAAKGEDSGDNSMPSPPGPPVVTALRVHQKDGPYKTIADAMRIAKVGDKIIVAPGKYVETLRMTRPVSIIGEGHVSDIQIESSGKDTFVFETEHGVLQNLTIRQKGTGFWNCVDCVSGQLQIEGCDITSTSLTCISVHRKDTRPRIWRTTVHNCGGTGIYFFDGCKGMVEDCDIHSNAQSGIEISEGSNPDIKFSRISANSQHGILVHDNGKGVFTDNEIFKNRLAGIEVRESGHPKIQRNKIFGHESSGGVYVHHYGRADLEKNDIYHNSLSGITCWQSGKPICRNNRVSKNGESVIRDPVSYCYCAVFVLLLTHCVVFQESLVFTSRTAVGARMRTTMSVPMDAGESMLHLIASSRSFWIATCRNEAPCWCSACDHADTLHKGECNPHGQHRRVLTQARLRLFLTAPVQSNFMSNLVINPI